MNNAHDDYITTKIVTGSSGRHDGSFLAMSMCRMRRFFLHLIDEDASLVKNRIGYMTYYAPHQLCTSPYKESLVQIWQYNTLLDAGKLSLKHNRLRTGAY